MADKDFSPLTVVSVFPFEKSVTVVLTDGTTQYIQSFLKDDNELQLDNTLNYMELPFEKRQRWKKHVVEIKGWK